MSKPVAIFEAAYSSGQESLWVTDGTSAGSSELSGGGADVRAELGVA